MYFDVVIAGGSVAGLLCAREVASNGFSVLVIEEDYEIGTPEHCGGLVSITGLEEIGVIPYSPMGGGLLSGKYMTKERPASGRLIENSMYVKRYQEELYFEVAERFTNHARERGVAPPSLAVAWVMAHPAITAPIIGARNLEQLEGSLGALEIDMTPEWRDEISAMSYTPPPPTDRSEAGK